MNLYEIIRRNTGKVPKGTHLKFARQLALVLVVILIVGASPGRGLALSSSPTNLTVNYTSYPLGIETNPHFAWDAQVNTQTAYQIQVGTSTSNISNMWDTGKITSSSDLDVAYTGSTLQSATRYYWQVRVYDASDAVSAWSAPAWFEMGLLNSAAWGSAQWIGGRQPQDHIWTDMTETVNFRVTTAGTGITFLFHAQPVGKTWGEAYSWKLATSGSNVQLVMSTRHYSGNTGVPGGSPAVNYGVNYYDPQSETNPTAAGTRTVSIATVQGTSLGGITTSNITTADHSIKIQIAGNTITTSLDNTVVDTRTLSGDQVRSDGTIGFGASGGGTIRSVTVTAPASPPSPGTTNGFSTSFAGASNPFEAGIATSEGL